MVLCQVGTGVPPIVKLNAPNEHVYQLSHGDQRDYCTGFKVLRKIYDSSFIHRHTSDINGLYNISI